jgi:hypothetical protein
MAANGAGSWPHRWTFNQLVLVPLVVRLVCTANSRSVRRRWPVSKAAHRRDHQLERNTPEVYATANDPPVGHHGLTTAPLAS